MTQITEIAPDITASPRLFRRGISNSINFSCATSSPCCFTPA